MPYLDYPVTFVDNVNQIPGASDLNQIRTNIITLDGLSYRRHPFFDGQAGPDTGAWNHHSRGNIWIYRGTLRYITGMTSITIQGYASNYGSNPENIRVYLTKNDYTRQDGLPAGSAVAEIPIANNWSTTIPLSGYADGDFILIDVRWDPATYDDIIDVIDVYGSPVTLATPWPGVPSFGASYGAASLNLLSTACKWTFNRINAIPRYPFLAQMYRQATHKSETIALLSGGVHKHYAQDVLRLGITVTSKTPKERLRLKLNGTQVWTSDWFVEDQTVNVAQMIDLSAYPTGAAIKAVLDVECDEGHKMPPNSRYLINMLRVDAASNYPALAAPAPFPENDYDPQATFTAQLNALAAMLTAIKTRMDNDPFTFNRVRAVRRRFAQDSVQFSRVAKRYIHRYDRLGARTVVRGTGINISYGANKLQTDETSDADEFKYEYANEQKVTDGDKLATTQVYLDSLDALYESVRYNVTGPRVDWCGEYLE